MKQAGLNASLELQCRETMEIRTKHLRTSFEAGFEAGLEGLKPMEIEAKQYDKEGTLFWSSKHKAGAKMGLASNADVAVERHCPHEWLSHQLQSSAYCTHSMAQSLYR